MIDFKFLTYELDGPVLTLTLNRPDVKNAISPALERELHEALDEADRDEAVRVVILTGSGDAFSSGYDMLAVDEDQTKKEKTSRAALRTWWDFDTRHPEKMFHIMHLSKPVIAAVNGWCLAGAFWYAMSCDITIASDRAVFGNVEVRQISNSSVLFAALAGWKHAHRYTLTGDHFDAHEALRIGLLNEVVPHEALLSRCRSLAERIALVPPDSVRLNKAITTFGLEAMGLRNALNVTGLISSIAHASRDAPELADLYELRNSGNLREFIKQRDKPFMPEPFGPRSRPRDEAASDLESSRVKSDEADD